MSHSKIQESYNMSLNQLPFLYSWCEQNNLFPLERYDCNLLVATLYLCDNIKKERSRSRILASSLVILIFQV